MMPLTAQDKEKILSFLESRLEPKVYDTWCRSLELEPAGDNAYRVPTANPFYRDWLEKLLRKPLEENYTCHDYHASKDKPGLLKAIGSVSN